jgi:hypothetical protein
MPCFIFLLIWGQRGHVDLQAGVKLSIIKYKSINHAQYLDMYYTLQPRETIGFVDSRLPMIPEAKPISILL